jgi:dihydroorotate dehydrogenase
LTGQPLKERSTEVIRYLYGKTGGKILIVGVGGIASGEDAYEKIRAGASLIQVYTGLIYEGPSLVKKINRTLVKLMERDGFSNIQEAVGSGSKLVIGK